MSQSDRVAEAMGHLGAALINEWIIDDKITVEHMRAAHELLRKEWREREARRYSEAKNVES